MSVSAGKRAGRPTDGSPLPLNVSDTALSIYSSRILLVYSPCRYYVHVVMLLASGSVNRRTRLTGSEGPDIVER